MSKKHTLNGVELEVQPIKDLVTNNEKLLAIKTVMETTNCGLVQAKNFVDQIFDLENFNPNVNQNMTNQGVSITNANGKIKVVYENQGVKKVVTPKDVEWQQVKAFMPNNELLKNYEQNYLENKTNNSNFIERNDGFNYQLLLIVAILILIVLVLIFFV